MASGKEHRRVGLVAGAGFALYRAREQPPALAALEALGGLYGGAHGARLHDLLEPATSPNHRGPAHSLVLNSAAFAAGRATVDAFQRDLRAWAATQLEIAGKAETPALEAFLRAFAAIASHFLVGYTNGFVGGAVSHLALDAPTPKGIPLLMRDF